MMTKGEVWHGMVIDAITNLLREVTYEKNK